MNLPLLTEIKKDKTTVSAFKGINRSVLTSKDCFSECENVVSDKYPAVVTRAPRTLLKDFHGPVQGVAYRNGKLLYIQDGIVYFGTTETGEDNPLNPDKPLTPGKKEIVGMGSFAVIYPDKVYFNTLGEKSDDSSEVKYRLREMEFHLHLFEEEVVDRPWLPSKVAVMFGLADPDGGEAACKYPGFYSDGEERTSETGDVQWVDSYYNLKRYRHDKKESYTVNNPLLVLQISSPALNNSIGISNPVEQLRAGDSITINCPNLFSGTYEIRQVYWEESLYSNGVHFPLIIAIDYPSNFSGKELFLKMDYSLFDTVDIDISVPDITFLTEDANRLWGIDSETGEIRACKQGDFRAWSTYTGVSSDSYAVSVGTDGEFTSSAKFGNNLLFFKEDSLCKLFGTKPSNYQLSYQKNVRSVDKLSPHSPQVVGDVLYYVSSDGVCAYDGSESVKISGVLGDEHFHSAVACGFADKYYVSMISRETGKRKLYVYDTLRGQWTQQGELAVEQFLTVQGGLYALVVERDGSHKLVGLDKALGDKLEQSVDWSITSCDIGLDNNLNKYITGFSLTYDGSECDQVKLSISVDGGEPLNNYTLSCSKLHSHSVPVRIPRCDRFRWKLSGKGQFKLFAINYFTEQGSESDVCV